MIHRNRQKHIFPVLGNHCGVAVTLAIALAGVVHAAEPVPDSVEPAGVEVSDEVVAEEVVEAPVDPEGPSAEGFDNEFETEIPTEDGGFYPTIDETMLLGGDYPRRGSNRNNPPDIEFQTAQGIYPYPNPGEEYRAPWGETLSPLNPFLGFFAPRQALISEDREEWPRGLSFDLDSSFPVLVRDFSPERAMLKAGPTYFDLMFVGMTVLHSDYQGQRTFTNDTDDGWLIGIEFGLRGMVQFTDQFYLSLAGTFIYLPLDNEVGFRLGSGGAPSAAIGVNYEFERGTWDIRLYDVFSVGLGYDVFAGLGEGAYQQAGRYSFGFNDPRRTSDSYNGSNAFFTNAIGFEASTPVWEDWRLWVAGEHSDTWRTWGFDNRVGHNSIYARFSYNASELRFAPALEYYLDHYDYYENDFSVVDHRVYLTANGRITENLRLQARAGYLWSSGRSMYEDGYLYSLALFHELSRYTSHSLSGGRDYFNHEFTGDTVVSSYLRYTINHSFTRSLTGSASIQYSEQDGRTFVGDRTNIAGTLRYALFGGNSSAISLRGAYEDLDGTQSGHRWLGRASYTQTLFTRTSAELFYQYEEASTFPSFNEQVFGCTLRRYF